MPIDVTEQVQPSLVNGVSLDLHVLVGTLVWRFPMRALALRWLVGYSGGYHCLKATFVDGGSFLGDGGSLGPASSSATYTHDQWIDESRIDPQTCEKESSSHDYGG
ncbi:hypothetical protein DY000_02061230 [Brassica cretica]|uniref:Uncharacterized protein n=1 Tax=Brassica cretica TaxID=69181 RepID=A0ABQ7B357_BRACR|nr:hypothetical protein DY000_02061230 [Brassica cretica]